jgi:RNA polymerase sigma factor (sigma-70 family)
MATRHAGVLLRHVRRFLHCPQDTSTDEQLLRGFSHHGDEAAFAALVARHGPHVWGVCLRVLGHQQDAEDAFQATFLILARKARSVRDAAVLRSWLHAVAHRIALRARAAAGRRRQLERQVPLLSAITIEDLSWRELRSVLDEELARLPESLRAPLLLCYYEGLTQDEAARQLGLNKRTLKARVERGRRRLRVRLAHRGLELGAVLAAPLLACEVPAAALMEAAGRVAVLCKTGQMASVPASALALAKGGLQAMMLGKVQTLAAGVAVLVLVGVSGVLWSRSREATAPDGQPAPPAKTRRVDQAGDPLPPGAVARLGTVRFRHQGNSFGAGLGFLSDHKTIVSAGAEDSIQLWDSTTGRLRQEVRTSGLSIRGFALAPDGRRIAVGGFRLPYKIDQPNQGAIRVLDLKTGKEVRTFARNSEDTDVCGLAFTPDAKLLISVSSRNGLLRVEEIAGGTELLRQQFPRDVGAYLALSPDGKMLAVISGPNSRKFYLWRWQSGEEPRELEVRDRVGCGVCFSPNSKFLAEISDDDASIRLWDVAAGQLLRKFEPPGPDTYWHRHVTFTPDGKTVAAAGYRRGWDGAVHLWDAGTGRFLRRLKAPGTSVRRLAVSGDGQLLAGMTDNGLRVWDLTTFDEVGAREEAHHGRVCRVAAAAGGVVTTASDDHTVRVWDAASGRQRFRLDHDHWVRGVALAPDGKRLASSSLDDTVRLWDLETGRELYRLCGHGDQGGRRFLTFTADAKRLLSWGDDFYLRVWDVRTGKAHREHRIRPTGLKVPDEDDEQKERHRIVLEGGSAASADGKIFVLAVDTKTYVFDTDTGRELHALETASQHIDSIALSPDGRRLLVSCWGKPIQVKLPDGRLHQSIADEHPVELWDLAAGKRLRESLLPGRTSGPMAFSADGLTFAAALDKPAPRVRLWDTNSGKEKWAIELPIRASALAFAPEGRFLITAQDDTTALVWELAPR